MACIAAVLAASKVEWPVKLNAASTMVVTPFPSVTLDN